VKAVQGAAAIGGRLSAEEEHEVPSSRGKFAGEDFEAAALKQVRAAVAESSGDQPLPEAFLRKCLVFQDWNIPTAITTARGFQRFRRGAGWPLRIPAADVAPALSTGMIWVLGRSPRAGVGGGDPPDVGGAAICAADGGGGDEPAACLVFNMARLDVDAGSIEDFQKMSMFLMERAVDRPEVQRGGIALVVDFRGVRLSRLLQLVGVEDMQRGVMLWKGAFPCRLRKIWLVCPPAGVQLITRAALQFLSSKVRKRVRLAAGEADLPELASDLAAFDLPEGLGGVGHYDWQAAVKRYLAESDCMDSGMRAGCHSRGAVTSKRPVASVKDKDDFASCRSGLWCCASRGYFAQAA